MQDRRSLISGCVAAIGFLIMIFTLHLGFVFAALLAVALYFAVSMITAGSKKTDPQLEIESRLESIGKSIDRIRKLVKAPEFERIRGLLDSLIVSVDENIRRLSEGGKEELLQICWLEDQIEKLSVLLKGYQRFAKEDPSLTNVSLARAEGAISQLHDILNRESKNMLQSDLAGFNAIVEIFEDDLRVKA